jgi:hypothetical protein
MAISRFSNSTIANGFPKYTELWDQVSSLDLGGVSKSGLHSWYDASNTSSVIHSSGNVTQWSDLSGNGRHAVIAGGGSNPTTGSTTQNGRNVINFNGVNQFLIASAAVNSNLFTFFAVYRRNSAAPSGNYGRLLSLFSFANNDYGNTDGMEIHTSAVTFGGITPPLVGLYRNGNQVAGSTIAYGTSYLFSGTLNGTSWSQNNSGTIVSGTTDAASLNSNQLNLGAGSGAGGGDAHFNGFFAEHIIFTRVLSAEEITAVRSYLSTKWGV